MKKNIPPSSQEHETLKHHYNQLLNDHIKLKDEYDTLLKDNVDNKEKHRIEIQNLHNNVFDASGNKNPPMMSVYHPAYPMPHYPIVRPTKPVIDSSNANVLKSHWNGWRPGGWYPGWYPGCHPGGWHPRWPYDWNNDWNHDWNNDWNHVRDND